MEQKWNRGKGSKVQSAYLLLGRINTAGDNTVTLGTVSYLKVGQTTRASAIPGPLISIQKDEDSSGKRQVRL
jgi:hypothetical protein